MQFTFKLRRDIAADWTSNNPVLHDGEPGIETDTYKFKIGNGIASWSDLDYFVDQTFIAAMIATAAEASGVVSVFGRSGTVVAQTGDYTKTQVGLGSVDNTADTAKPISTATQTALDLKASVSALTSHTGDTANPHAVTKTQVGLSNVDNTADTAKPVSTAQQTALDLKATIAAPSFTGGVTITGKFVNTPVTLTDAAPVATNAALGTYFRVTITADRTLANPTNPVDGQRVIWEIEQGSGGSKILTLGSDFAFGSDLTEVVLSITAGKKDLIGAIYSSVMAKWLVVMFIKGF